MRNLGFDLDRVVNAFEFVGIDSNDGGDYPLELWTGLAS